MVTKLVYRKIETKLIKGEKKLEKEKTFGLRQRLNIV
jgi:hypothetical protein